MPTDANTPSTVEALLRIVSQRDAEVARLQLLVDKLKLQLLRRAREQFGASSEQLGSQLSLIANDAPQAPIAPVVALQPRAQRKPRKAARQLPEHLPRETLVHHPEGLAQGLQCACAECGGKLRQLGEDVSEQLEHVPASFKVIRHVRPKLACMRCQRIFQAGAASRPIQRGLPGPGLLAQVLVAKYCDHLPLYRQSQIYAREGVHIERSTMVDWVARSAELLDPLVSALGRYTLGAAKLHSDDTPVKVLDPGRGKTKTARLWVYVRDDRPGGSADAPAAWFQYSPDRKGERPRSHLARYCGILQADGYAGYDKREVTPILDKVQALPQAVGQVSGLLADSGYFSAANVNACEARFIEPMLSMKREAHHIALLERFAADAPAPESADPVAKMAHRLRTKKGRLLYGLRKQTVEPVFGIIKCVMGWSQMSMRGLAKARGEWSLVTMAWNIKRLHVLRAA